MKMNKLSELTEVNRILDLKLDLESIRTKLLRIGEYNNLSRENIYLIGLIICLANEIHELKEEIEELKIKLL
jgi:hypothetical protein